VHGPEHINHNISGNTSYIDF